MKLRLNLFFLLPFLLLGGCSGKHEQITGLEMLRGGKAFAVPTGTAADQMVLKYFPDATIEYYNSILDCAIAVRDGKADATVYDKPVLKNIVAKNPGLVVLPGIIMPDHYGFAVSPGNAVLKQTIDQVVARLKADGTYEDMNKRWFPDRGSPASMPNITSDGKNGELRFGTAAVTEPMSYFNAEKQIIGFDIELAYWVAKALGKKLVIVDMDFGAMIPALISGKVDMIGAGLSITAERAKKVVFSEAYYEGGLVAVVAGKTSSQPKPVPSNKSGLMKSVGDIANRSIGVLLGSVHDAYAIKNYPEAEIKEYQTNSDLLTALNSDKIDVAFLDQSAVKPILDANPEIGVLDESLFTVPIGAGFNKDNDGLREQFNTFLDKIKAEGVYNDMLKRWMDQGLVEMPPLKLPDHPMGVLRLGVVSDLGLPWTIIKDGQLCGFDIELGQRFAAFLNRSYEPVDMPFPSLIAAVSTNKIDLITSSLLITDERKKQIDFSNPYYESGVSLIARKMNLAAYASATSSIDRRSFMQKVSESFYSNIVYEKRYLQILSGLEVTVLITLLSAILGTFIGAIVCRMRMAASRLLSGMAKVYINILRGTPVLVLLMIIYYVVFASVNVNPVLVSVIAFGMNFGAYVSEIFRTSIESIDKGLKEAAIAGGFRSFQAFHFIILPQALKSILPVYKGEFISMLKMTSVVGYIAVQDLTKASDIIRSRTFEAFFPLIMVAVLYFLMAYLLTLLMDLLINKSSPGLGKKNGKSGKEVAV